VPFPITFARDLPFGRCVAVALPGEGVRDEDLAGLHPDEAAYARALVAARRRTWVGGRLALRAALRDLGGGAEPAAILATARGAPALGPGLVGSVSHKEAVAVALAARAPTALTLGIDVEVPRAPRTDIAPRVLTPDERRRLDGLDAAAAGRELLVAFSAKEAIYKALDPWLGRYVAFRDVAITRGEDGRLRASLALASGEGPFSVELHEEPAPGLVLIAARIRAG
jgi:phosphopantetheine--protein transferase-like protein